MFTYTTKSGKLTIREVHNGFQVDLNGTDQTRGCGDGTQWVSPDDQILAASEQERLRNDRVIDDIEGGEAEWLEAYFNER